MTRAAQTGIEVWRVLMLAAMPGARRRQHPAMEAERLDVWIPCEVSRRLDAQLARLNAKCGARLTRSEFLRLAVGTWVSRLEAVSDHDMAATWARTALRQVTRSVPGPQPKT